ncbi:MAG: hypothetical protein QW341_00380 [Candidatus Bathyarchaeia archaeon]
MSKPDSSSRIGPVAGIIVFFIGVALLAFTFYSGIILLLYPERLAAFAELIPASDAGDGLTTLVARVVAYLIPVLLMFVLGYVASKIAAHGMQMYRVRLPAAPKGSENEEAKG